MSPAFRDTRARVSVQGVTFLPASASSPAPSSLRVHVVDFSWAERSLGPLAWRLSPLLVWGGHPSPCPSRLSAQPASSLLALAPNLCPCCSFCPGCSHLLTLWDPTQTSLREHFLRDRPLFQPGRAGPPSLLRNALCTPSFHPSRCRDFSLHDGSPCTAPTPLPREGQLQGPAKSEDLWHL